MKLLRNILFATALLGCGQLSTSCTDYQDEIDALDYRVTVLEELVRKINIDIDAMSVIAQAMETGDYITDVRETADGYLINFHQAGPVYIVNGVDGADGRDAVVPDITIAQDPADGNWYWMLNGSWLLADGQKVRANGKDGRDGADAVSPQVRINPDTTVWEISTDGGATWISTGTSAQGRDGAAGKDGKDGRDGQDGQDGKDGVDGKDGNQFFMTVTYEINGSEEFMVITTKSGQKFKIPIYQNQ